MTLRNTLIAAAIALTSIVPTPSGAADTQSPHVFVDMESGTTTTSPLVLTGTATDNVAIDRVRVSIRDTATKKWLQPGGGFRRIEHRFEATLVPAGPGVVEWRWRRKLPSGNYLANIRVVDTSGNRGAIDSWPSFKITGTQDSTPPSVSTTLAKNETFTSTVNIEGSATDNAGVRSVRVGIRDRVSGKWLHPDGTFKARLMRLPAVLNARGAPNLNWSIRLDLPEGLYAAAIKATDTSGNRKALIPRVRFSVSGSSPGSVILTAAGDIARCSSGGDEKTADLLDDIFANRDGLIAMLGDGAYQDGTAAEYRDCYDPTWGRHKARTKPAVGNHEYHTANAAGYFGYFGAAAGDPDEGFYAYNHGAWRVIVINTECDNIGGCDVGSPQHDWLKAELAANNKSCILAYGHKPRYTAGPHGDETTIKPLWKLLDAAGADVILAGHSHNYQRYAKMDASGNATSSGIRSFVVGTGGANLIDMDKSHAHLDASVEGKHGVLLLELFPGRYTWEFKTVNGGAVADSGSGSC